MTPLRFLVRRRSAFTQITRGLDLNLRSRLRQVFFWLLVLTALHTTAMMLFEGLRWDDALWLTLTTLTTVGYGDLSAATPAGRVATVLLLYVAGITLLAQLASDYIDHRLKRKEYMLKGRWRSYKQYEGTSTASKLVKHAEYHSRNMLGRGLAADSGKHQLDGPARERRRLGSLRQHHRLRKGTRVP